MDTKNYYKYIRENFKAYRINYPMTQEMLAEKSGISTRSITRFENGGDITLSNFLRLLDALGLADHISMLIPDQSHRPSMYLSKEKPRKRAASENSTIKKKTFKWGDET